MIKKYWKVLILILIATISIFTSPVLGVTIVTGEKSEDNDEYDQKVTVDETTNAEEEVIGTETYTLKQKIEKELETQLKRDMASSAKATISNEIYKNEATIKGDIQRIWKQSVGKEIDDENLEKIYESYVNVIEEYSGKKIDKWIDDYYTNNKDLIVNKIIEYINGDESQIVDGVSIVVYTAVDPINKEMESLVGTTNTQVSDVVKEVLDRYTKITTWEEKAIDAIQQEIGLAVKGTLEKTFSESFSWQNSKLTEAFEYIKSYPTEIADDFKNSVLQDLANRFGFDISGQFDFEQMLTDYIRRLAEEQLNKKFEPLVPILTEKGLTAEEIEEIRKNMVNGIDIDIEKDVENMWEQIERDFDEKISNLGQEALKQIANMTGELATSYAMQLYDELFYQIDAWAEKLGTIGQALVNSITAQIGSWIRENIAENIASLVKGAFGQGGGEAGWSDLEINWPEIGRQVLWSWAMSNEKLAKILDGYGGFFTGVKSYEELAETPYAFILKGRTLIPTMSFVSAISVAETYAGQSKSIGDSGKLYSDTFGIKELMGYNENQFLPMGSNTIILNLPPFTLVDYPKMTVPHLQTITKRPVKYILAMFRKNVTAGRVIPSWRVYSLPLVGPYYDSAYVACEFGQNAGNDSYVQRAFSYTSLALMTGGVPFSPTDYSEALLKEAQKYSEFAVKVTAALGYQNTLKDLTDESKLKVRYLDSMDWFIAGPFKVDYLKSSVETEERGRIDFGMMVDMKVYYKDTVTGEEKEIPKNSWQILFSENGEADIDFSTSRYEEEYIFPYPEEEFYICLDKAANPDITNISKIKMKFKEMQVAMYGQTSNLEYEIVTNTPYIIPIPTHHGVTYLDGLNRMITGFKVHKNALFSIIYAKRYYLNWEFEITLNKKSVTTPAYETADYTTSSSIKTSGADEDSILYGSEINSSLYNSLANIVKNYTENDRDKYNSSGATFVESLNKISSIYTSADGDTSYIKGLNSILKAISENDATKSLSSIFNITNSGSDFKKVAQISKLVSESKKMRELATVIDTIVEIYKNTNDNVGMNILELLNETTMIYNNTDYSKVMDSINEAANNCEYKSPVFGIVAQSASGGMTNEQMETFLQSEYPGFNEDKKALITSTAKSIISILSNSGDNGKNILGIIEKSYKLFTQTLNISDVIISIVEYSGDKELQAEYRKYENILQINKKIAEINNDETLSLAEKYKNIQEEQIKLFKATSVAAIEMNNGATITDAIERAYGESSNIEKQILSKFQTIVKELSTDEMASLTKSLEKSSDVENTLDIVNAELVRTSLKGEEEKAKVFMDILEENASLYDRTPYTEYDSKFNITKVERPNDVYYMGDDKADLTMTIAGVVWKDGHTGLENDYDGVRTANTNGDIEKGIEGVKVTLIDSKTNQVGRMKVNGKWTEAVTYTDEGGYYHFEEVESDKYYVEFTYDGHKYMPTTTLSDGTKRTVVSTYKQYPDLEMYDNNSKATEVEEDRIAFNDKFYNIQDGMAYSKDGQPLTVNGQMVNLEYEEKDGVSELITLDNEGHVLPQFAMTASTKTLGITYPIDSEVTLDDETTETLTSQYLNPGLVYGEYKKTGEYMYHVNLGLVERSKLDLATTQDVYEVKTTVNEKQETYSYNQRGGLSVFDSKLKNTEAYKDLEYTRELYNADYQLRLEDYAANSLNKVDRDGKDKASEIEKIKEIKELEFAKGGLEQRAFVTYKITLKNQSMLQGATINEIVDYFDANYKLVEEDTYQDIQNSEGIVENKLVAKQSYFIVQSDNSATEYKLIWEENGMVNGLKSMHTVQTEGIGLEDVILRAQDEIYVFVTFEVEKDSNRALALGKKENIVEISSYTSIEVGEDSKEHSIGLIDKDSAPDNISVGQRNTYEDDTDAAPVIDFKLYSTDLRNINGYVWNDDRDVTLSTGQIVGNGIREEKEELINGVRVQLVEKVRDPLTGAEYEYVWKEMFTGEDNYKHIGSSGSITNTERGQTISTGSVISDTNLGAVQKGEYKFHDYIAGNFIVRFIYGDTYKTYLAKGSENAEGEGLNETSYNGEDYKSTAYLKGNNLNAKWYDLSGFDKEDKLYSDAKDDTARRNKVIEYAETLQNDKAEILASFDEREDKYYYNRQLHQALRDNTWMFADTAKINVNVEYNTTKSNGLTDKTYRIKNMDFGLEQRPETKIELTKEITDIKITLASGETIINTAEGMSQNVNWVSNKKTEVKGHNYKRDNLRYEYREGKIHIYMDEEVMQGANVQITYKITVTNNSQIDYTGENGSLGYTYFTGQVSSSDKIVTTTVNKIIDYVDNSLTFRKVDSPDWSLIETMREFTTTSSGSQIETERMDYGTFIELMMKKYGENYVAKHLREFEASFKVYQETGKIQEIGSAGIEGTPSEDDTSNDAGSYLSNYNVIQNMKDRENSIGYLNEDISLVKTKSAKTTKEPITQIIVTKALENTALKPGDSASVQLILSKTLSPNDEDDTLTYSNMAEILQYSNTVGRRDMDAIPGNQEPDEEPYEYDTDFTERILITPPTGANKAIYFVLTATVLVILAGGIIIIKKKVIDKK